eukprot:GEMP01035370.1.p1 GENE.GEMP01035370.1~~GEMP01035370.1.p1  ORF type:complete len:132 (-),score=34.33 GEMP01035370.1:1598-1993(-)
MDWPPPDLDFNTRKFPRQHQMVEMIPNEKEKLRVCRCWQSKKFPYCDDTHKQLMEAGDDVGPYIFRFRKPVEQTNLQKVAADLKSKVNARNVAFSMIALGIGYAAGNLLRPLNIPVVDVQPVGAVPHARDA